MERKIISNNRTISVYDLCFKPVSDKVKFNNYDYLCYIVKRVVIYQVLLIIGKWI